MNYDNYSTRILLIKKKLKIKTKESCGQIVSLVLYFEKKRYFITPKISLCQGDDISFTQKDFCPLRDARLSRKHLSLYGKVLTISDPQQ